MKKMITAILLSMAAMSIVGGCSAGFSSSSGGSSESTVVEDVGPNITDMSEETVVETHKLQEIIYEEGETQTNPYYKKGNDAEGNVCYIVNFADEEGDVFLPLDGTVIYTMTEEESYMEKVQYSYKLDGELVEEEQNRLYINTGTSEQSSKVDVGTETDADVNENSSEDHEVE